MRNDLPITIPNMGEDTTFRLPTSGVGKPAKRAPKDEPAMTRNDGTAYTGRPAWQQSSHSTQTIGVTPGTRGRGTGPKESPWLCGGGREPQGESSQNGLKSKPGEPDDVKASCPVREGAVRKGPSGDTARIFLVGLWKKRYLAGRLLHRGGR
jgi:hypothetical protein